MPVDARTASGHVPASLTGWRGVGTVAGVNWLDALWYVVGLLAELGPGALVAGSAAAAGVLIVAVLAARALLVGPVARSDVTATRQSLRERARQVRVPRHRDPDAAGRSRPRAPTAALAAA